MQDHYMMGRPIPPGYTNWASRSYLYGSTGGGRYRVHHGIDLQNPRGTPVRAAADGEVIFAGSDADFMLGPQLNFYGNAIIIQHDFTTADGRPVFSLYGHLADVQVQVGQRVGVYETIGLVGDEGVAIGPHLHFEVRVGDPFDYGATRNPLLWIQPYPGWGTLAGRVVDANGNYMYEAPLTVTSLQEGDHYYVFTYADASVNPDDVLGENFVVPDLPAGYYEVTFRGWGHTERWEVYVYPNQTTWLEIAPGTGSP